jgi:hypothetical protein
MSESFREGDQVEWNSHGSTATGVVEQKITSRAGAGGRTVDASKGEPRYLVRSDKSGGTAVAGCTGAEPGLGAQVVSPQVVGSTSAPARWWSHRT